MPERAREIVELLTAGGVGAGMVGGFWAWLSKRPTGQAAVIEAATKLQEALNQAAERQVAGFQTQIDSLTARIEELEGDLRQEQQRSLSLESILRKNGYDLSAATEPGAFTSIDPRSGSATVISPRRRRK